jgi:hypothetical protein
LDLIAIYLVEIDDWILLDLLPNLFDSIGWNLNMNGPFKFKFKY